MKTNKKHEEVEKIVKDEFDIPEENENEIIFFEEEKIVSDSSVEHVNEISNLLEKIDEQVFIDVAKLYDVGDTGHVLLNIATKEKRFMPSSNIYYVSRIKRFSMPLAEFNNLDKI